MPSGQMRTVDAARFAMVPRPDVPRSAFDTSHYHKTTFNASELVPVYVEEVLPGDTISVRMNAFCRLATPIVPVMDNLMLESFFFFVPNRLVWTNWKRFMGEKISPTDSTQFLTPTVSPVQADCVPTTLYDYMGITVNVAAQPFAVLALPFRAYNLVWNEFFRDQDIQTQAVVPLGDGPDTVSDYQVLVVGKRPDAFTTARPWPQKPANVGSTSALAASEPGGPFSFPTAALFSQGAAPITGIGYTTAQTTTAGPTGVKTPGNRALNYAPYFTATGIGIQASGTDGWPDIKVLVNDIRTATLIQQMLERDARGGTRYTERIQAHFGVRSPDARLQRPEYLGGGRTMVTVHPLAQTSATGLTGGTTVLGQQSGIGTISVYEHRFSQSFTEHGFILGLIAVRADLAYQNGVNRMFYRRTMFDYYWPGLNGLGEQAIQNRELFAVGAAADFTVFGYQERWVEYKWKPSRISGGMRSSSATPLDMWHFAENFSAAPTLNAAFITDDSGVTVNRVLQVGGFDNEQFLGDFLFDARMVRCMPMFSLPGMGARL